jgi:hypothetical protein
VVESDGLKVVRIKKRLEVDNCWIGLSDEWAAREHHRRRAIAADGVADDGLHGVVEVVARRANLDRQHQRDETEVRVREIGGLLKTGDGPRAAQSDHGRAPNILPEAHVSDEAGADVGTDVPGRSDHEQIDVAR